MPLPTSRFSLNKQDIDLLLPGLEVLVNGVANAADGIRNNLLVPLGQGDVYQKRRFDAYMAARLLAARNKIKSINSSRKVRLDSLEIAAVALALRTTRRKKLAGEAGPVAFDALAQKLEIHRKRAKLAAIEKLGALEYQQLADRWGHFVEWIRFSLLSFHPRRRSQPVPSMYKEQREQTRALMLDLVDQSALSAVDLEKIKRLADLARREIRRGRHDTKVRELLADPSKARKFLISFLVKHGYIEQLKPEVQPPWLRMSNNGEAFKKVMVVSESEISSSSVPSGAKAAPVPVRAQVDEGRRHSAMGTKPTPHVGAVSQKPSGSAVPPTPTTATTKQYLPDRVGTWLTDEVNPGYWQDVVDQIRFLVVMSPQRKAPLVNATNSDDIIAECRPAIAAENGPEMINFYVEWAIRWLLAAEQDVWRVCAAAGDGLLVANKLWKQMDELTRQRKLAQIYRSYFSESIGA